MTAHPYPISRKLLQGMANFFAGLPTIARPIHGDSPPGQTQIRRNLISLAIAQTVLPLPGYLHAEPAPCSLQTPSSITCSGNQSGGIATGRTLLTNGSTLLSPPVTTLNVNTLAGAIAPVSGSPGIYFHNEAGSALSVNAGTTLTPISITVSGGQVGSPNSGIFVSSFGTPTGSWQLDSWFLPTGTGGSGGAVTVNSFATITTDGDDSPGISARSRAGGYPQPVVDTLTALGSTSQGTTFTLSAVQGDSAKIGQTVTGSNGGTFTFSNAGLTPAYTYNLSSMALSTLTAGQHIDTSVSYSVASWLGWKPSTATLTLRVMRLADGSLTVLPLTYFTEYGRGYAAASPIPYVEGSPAVAGQISLQPDYNAYLARLNADAAVGGSGGNVVVNAHGSITTRNNTSFGQGSHGILAQSKGGTGSAGGGGVFSGDPGGAGAAGGTVTVNNQAEIHTHGIGAHGIVAASSGGDGGRGGSTSFIGNGAAGGAGGKGGAVTVDNDGKITTESDGAFGILAQSGGGRGGVGGDGGWLVGGGGSGGAGTPNDAVNVDNSGEITTHGVGSHGILTQNIGGFGGNSGSALAVVALSSTGGNAGTGGEAHITNTAKVTTTGLDANALVAQSIGGGGGSAGNSAGLVALGGDGTAGGNGGLASITNSGQLSAKALGSVGILAQSIGGGGGNGGNSLGIVPIGGDGATTSDGGTVTVSNSGKIESSSNAILAESIGGGGGAGGSTIGWFAIGGTGGGGGTGGTVQVTNSGDLTTTGRNASALFAQSVGGGGGKGGNVVAVGAFASLAIGGDGGAGGDGSEVVVNSTGGKINTEEEQSHGIFAQSLGGKGGSGGFAVSLAAGKGLSVSLSVGGTGGGGGDGKHVQVDSQSEITTVKNDSHGIFAQSVGGGGGAGGFAASAAGTVDGIAASFAVGGTGGLGGKGGQVEVGKTAAVGGKINTSGNRSDGIFAQSVGGGGGHGGLSVAGNISGGGSGGGFSLSLGGQGGSGGDGMDVHVKSQATITTEGEQAYGIRAQSIGGGGGDGGLAVAGSVGGGGGSGSTGSVSLKFDFAIGGKGGSGGSGDTVDVDVTGGSIATGGKGAHAIFAQSVGGGGGIGGMAISGTLGLGANNLDVSFAVGGKGGGGGTGKKVTVNNAGKITTEGENAFGIFAQSIGGGGGVGGASYSAEAIINRNQQGPNFNIGFAFGGSGGSGGDGGAVDVTNRGSIETSGIAAHGIFAESVGGGGGQGGSARTMSLNYSTGMTPASSHLQFAFNLNMGGSGGAAGDGKTVTVNNIGTIITNGPDAHGIYAQSVGGGGGTGGEGAHGFFGYPTLLLDKTPFYENVSISIGGSAGAAGDGGTVTVNQCVGVTPAAGESCGSITTKTEGSRGIFAQSVGGGGGTGGVGVIGLTGTLGIGGASGASGDGGKVEVTVNGDIDTFGGNADGIYAQSVGGGGGIAGNVDRGIKRWSSTHENIGIGFGIVANSENGGDGGEVIVKGNGSIHTRGLGAAAIFAQSVGGGGGVAGTQGFFGVTGSAGGNGAGDKVTVDWTGSIVTDGTNAHGIYAQSAGGTETETHYTYTKDGVPVSITLTPRQNLGKDVLVDVKGSVVTNGEDSAAIYAQSTGDQGNGNVTVKLASGGKVVGGKTTGVGIQIIGGAGNLIENRGSVSALSGQAILANSGNERIDNYGTISGSVDLGTGSNVFNNLAGSAFNPLATITLGSGRLLTNDGTLSPGGQGNVQTSTLTGNLLQSSSGVLGIDYSLAGRSSDRLNVAGTANVGGSVQLNPVDTGRARVGTQQAVIFSASSGTTPSSLTLNAPRSPLVSYALSYPNANDVAITSRIDFRPGRLGGNAGRIGTYLNAVQQAGGSESLAPYVAALFGLTDEASLKTAYEKLGPGALGTITTAATTSSLEFNDAMHSCRQRDGDYRFIREGDCNWIRLGGSIRDQERNDQNPGYTQDVVTMAGGFQKAIRDNLHLGFGVSYQQSTLDSIFSDVTGERFEGGMILKQRFDATRLSLSFSAGYGHYNTRRLVDIATPGVHAQAKPTLWSGAVHGRISHDIMASENAYVRPMLGLGVSYVSREAYNETGAGGANLRVEKKSDTIVSLHPAIEFGGESGIGSEGTLLRHFLRIGITHYPGSNERQVTASLEGAPAGIEPFTVTTRSEKTYADLTVGFDILRKSGTTVRLEYNGQFSADSTTKAVGIKVAMPF